MKALYEKVAADPALQEKFKKIIERAEDAGEEATGNDLQAFAKEAGFSVDLAEAQEFFRNLAPSQEGELSDQELDMVAGGKAISEKVVTIVLGVGGAAMLAVSIGGDLLKLGCTFEKAE